MTRPLQEKTFADVLWETVTLDAEDRTDVCLIATRGWSHWHTPYKASGTKVGQRQQSRG